MDVFNATTMVTYTSFPPKTLTKITFSWYDYTLFGGMLLLSTVVGIYFGFFGKRQTSAAEYLLGGKTMTPIPIAMSLTASTVSGISLLAIPADIYSFGVQYWLCCFAIWLTCALNVYVYLPVFHKLEITSAYEYFKLRFDTKVQVFASFLFTLSSFLYLPMVIYVPALALAQATDFNIYTITISICTICIFYTTIGGLKAVVWTDMLQFSITIGSMVAVLFMGTASAGGIGEVFRIASEKRHLDIDFDVSPLKRETFWEIIFGWSVVSLSHLVTSQSSVQKFLSVPSIKEAKQAVFYYILGIIFVKSSCAITGLIMLARYSDCDPYLTQSINKADQLLPYYVMDVAASIPGLPGLFIAGVFCAALSTLSAVLNCVSGTIYEDFLKSFMPKDITEKRVSDILKLIVVVVGAISTGLVFLVERLDNLLAISIAFTSLTAGPLLGMFTLGMLFPKANSKGALIGGIASLMFMSWTIIGSQWYKASGHLRNIPKPVSTDACDFEFTPRNVTYVDHSNEVFFLYRITHYYYALFSAVAVLVVGIPVSWIFKEDRPPIHIDLLSPVIHFMLPKEEVKKSTYYSVDHALQIITDNSKVQNEV